MIKFYLSNQEKENTVSFNNAIIDQNLQNITIYDTEDNLNIFDINSLKYFIIQDNENSGLYHIKNINKPNNTTLQITIESDEYFKSSNNENINCIIYYGDDIQTKKYMNIDNNKQITFVEVFWSNSDTLNQEYALSVISISDIQKVIVNGKILTENEYNIHQDKNSISFDTPYSPQIKPTSQSQDPNIIIMTNIDPKNRLFYNHEFDSNGNEDQRKGYEKVWIKGSDKFDYTDVKIKQFDIGKNTSGDKRNTESWMKLHYPVNLKDNNLPPTVNNIDILKTEIIHPSDNNWYSEISIPELKKDELYWFWVEVNVAQYQPIDIISDLTIQFEGIQKSTSDIFD